MKQKRTLSDKEILSKFKSQLDKGLLESDKSDVLIGLLEDWIQGRREMNRRMTTGAVKIAANKLNKHSIDTCIFAVEEAVEKSYIGVFPDNHRGKKYAGKITPTSETYDITGTRPDIRDTFSATVHLKNLFDSDSILGFSGYDHPEDVFFDEIYTPARGLGLLDKPKELVEALFGLMKELSRVRKEAEVEYTERFQYTVSPREIMDRYLKWLVNQNWMKNITLKVFDFEGSVFNSFVRQESRSNNNGHSILYGDWL